MRLPVPLREREMTLLAAQANAGDLAHIPDRLVRLAADVRATYATFTENADAQMDAAAQAGVAVIEDIVYRVPSTVDETREHILAVMAETDDYCRGRQYLLALATPPDVRDYQQRILGELIRQARGGPPVSWEEFRTRRR